MSTIRQYIGARYVTKIYENSVDPSSAEWEAGVTYEPLTMVTYNNSSYLSKKDVPGSVGDPASNPSYWVVTGAYNGQIAALQNQIDTINNTTIPNLANDIQTLTDDVDDLSADVDNISNIVNRKVLFIGDSFCDTNRGGFAEGVATTAQLASGIDSSSFFIFAKGGAGFVANGQGKTFLDLLNDATADTTFDNSDITDIIVQTAGNDVGYGYSAINTAITNFMTQIATDYANCNNIMIAPTYARKDPSNDNTALNELFYILCYPNTAKKYTTITNASLPMRLFTSFDSGDPVHPNTQGVVLLGQLIGSAIKSKSSSGTFLVSRISNGGITLDGAFTANYNRALNVKGFGDNLYVDFPGMDLTGSISISTNGGTIKLGTETAIIANSITATYGGLINNLPITAIVKDASNIYNINGFLSILYDSNNDTNDVYFVYNAAPATLTATRIILNQSNWLYNI